MNQSPVLLTNIDTLIDRYRYFLVDQFGVLHNGQNAYAGAADALRSIRHGGGKVIIISNSGKRATSNHERLARLGFTGDCIDRVVSSGETAWHLLRNQIIGQRVPAGAKTFFLANDADRSAVEGLNLTEVPLIEQAQLILLTGQLLKDNALAALCRQLTPALEKNLLCICTNPDKVAFAKDGSKRFSSGTVAQWYQDQGGEVIWLGKPYREIYDYIFDVENITNKSQVVCVGDSVEHDIAGAASQGLDTVLVRTGIADHLTDTQMQQIFQQHNHWPTYLIPSIGG